MITASILDWGKLASKYEEQGYIDIAFDSDAEELAAVIAALREAQSHKDAGQRIGTYY